jgi:alanine-glyoxylate transaminase/serine-glyoxylate transaminase/serine-pyruvate transaminase
MTRIPGNRFLHAPGPTHVPGDVLNAMHRQPLDHGDPRLDACIAACEAGLKRLLQTENSDVFMFASNGHGAWESAIENLLAPGQTVLIPGTGHFSEQWSLQAEGLGRKVIRTPWIEGYPIDPKVVEAALRADTRHEIVALFAVHTDTASGTTSDMKALRDVLTASGHPALFVVDVVASLGALPFAMDALGANAAIGASQKGLMTPPGMGFVAVDEKAFAVASANPAPRNYWDWRRRKAKFSYQKFGGTPPQNLLFGLEAALSLIFAEGVDAVYARHALLSSAVHAALTCWSREGALKFHCQVPAARSVSVTTIEVAKGVDPDALRTTARERFQVAIAGGLGPFGGRAFRIGHLGDLNPAMILGCLAGVEAAMIVQKIPFGRDGVEQAIACLAQG